MIALSTAKYISGPLAGFPPDHIDPGEDDLSNMAIDASVTPAIYDVINDAAFSGIPGAPIYIAQLKIIFVGVNIQWGRLGNSTAVAGKNGVKVDVYETNEFDQPTLKYEIAKFRDNAEMTGAATSIIQDPAGAGQISATMNFGGMFNEYLLLNNGWRIRVTIDVDLSSNTIVRGVASGRVTPGHSAQGLG